MTTITNVLFDLDGTLADTAPDLARSLNLLLEENGKPHLPFEAIRPMVSRGGIFMVCKAFNMTADEPAFPALRERFLSIYEANLDLETRLFPGMTEVLERLEANDCTWGIVTNKIERLTFPLIRSLCLTERAACIVCGDTVEHSKPHPAPMLHACQLVNRQPAQTLYVGDAENDVIAGRTAEMHTLVARYGYIGCEEEPDSWGADGLIDTPLEILDWLENKATSH